MLGVIHEGGWADVLATQYLSQHVESSTPVTLALCTFTDPNASAVSGPSSDENFRLLTQVLRQNSTIVGSQLHSDTLLGWPALPVPVFLCLLIASLVYFD